MRDEMKSEEESAGGLVPPATVGGWLDSETRGRATIQADIGRDEESWVKRGGKKCRQRGDG